MPDDGRIKLGELLVRQGFVDRARLLSALTRQHGTRIRLGSLLVELGQLAPDDLAEVLASQTGVPAAVSGDFQAIAPDCIAAVPRQVCLRHAILPIWMDAQVLHVAAIDPQQSSIFDELGVTLGLRVLPHVVPETLLRQHLRRYHAATPRTDAADSHGRFRGISLHRDARLADAAAETRQIAPPQNAPVSAMRHGAAAEEQIPEMLDVVFLDEVTSRNPWTHDDWDVEIDTSEIAAFDASDIDIDISFETFDGSPQNPAEVVCRLREAPDRDRVVQCLLQPVLPHTTMMALLVPHGDVAAALAAWGTDLTGDQVRALVVPLSTPSLIKTAFDQRSVQLGQTTNDAVQAMISTYLRTAAASHSCVVPVHLGDRVVNLVYMQSTAAAGEEVIEPLSRIAAHAAEAYRRMIRQRRAASSRVFPRNPGAADSG